MRVYRTLDYDTRAISFRSREPGNDNECRTSPHFAPVLRHTKIKYISMIILPLAADVFALY